MRGWRKAGLAALVAVTWAVVFVAGRAWAAAGAVGTYGAEGALWQAVLVPVDEAVTVVSRFVFPDEAEERNVEAFLLAGFATEEGGVPRRLAVRWRRDGWFQLWTLGIDSDLGNLPSALRPAAGSGAWAGYRSVTLEGGKFPEAGHVYETTVSYAPRIGFLAVSVVDVTTQQTFYRGTLQLAPVDATLYAGTGALVRGPLSEAPPPWLPALVQWLPEPVPAGVRWRLVERSASGAWLPVTRLDRSKELALEVDAGSGVSLPGELRFVLRIPGADEAIALGRLTEGQGVVLLPVDGQRLPAGRLEAAMEYIRDSAVRFAEVRRLESGLIEVTAERLRFDPETASLAGALIVRTDGLMAPFAVEARLAARGRLLLGGEERAEEWAAEVVVVPAGDPVRLPFALHAGTEPARWTVEVDAGVRAPEGVRVHVEVPSVLTSITGDATHVVLNKVKEQYLAEFVLPAGAVTLSVPAPREDGSWADVAYADQSVGGWKAVPHLERVLEMARAYAAPQSALRGSDRLRDEIVRALEFWVVNKFRNPNWWWNVIWQPQRLGDILLLMGDALPAELREAALGIMRAEVLQTAPGAYTGANLVWNEGNRLRIGLITEDLEMVAWAFEAMASELRVVSVGKEGIQADGSFHQHGAMLYSGGYGDSFAGDLVRFAYVARGTGLFPPEALAVLVDYLLDGQQWMVRGLTFDFSATGRVLSREQASGNASHLIGLVRTLSALPGVPRRDELNAFLARLLGAGEPLVGNRYFWTSDFMVHHRPGFYVSVKAASNRTLATEIGNYENLKGHHLGDGMMFIMRTGTEYDQTFPVWNWELLPGTTVRHMEHPLLLDGSWLTVPGAGNPAGGVSDGMYGALAMHLQRDGMGARKAWFFFDREIVALGADVRVPQGATVTTSVNQARLVGDVVLGRTDGPEVLASDSEVVLDDVQWVYHGGVTYVLPAGGAVHVANKVQRGRWSDINSVYSNLPLSIPIFTLWFDHSGAGAKAYAYIVAPGVQRSEAAAYAASHGVVIVANDARAQAVWHGPLRQLQAVFWEAGTVTAPDGLSVSAGGPALVIVKERDDTFEVTVGPLERVPGTVPVRVERMSAGRRQAATGEFTFAAGDTLGSSVTQTLPAPWEEA